MVPCIMIGKGENGMSNKPYDDSNWREESLPYYTGKQEELLKNGPKSLSQSWILGAMYNEWKRRNGYKDPEPPNVSSSLGEFFKKQEDIENG